jgi:hypothetical protein
MKKYTVTVKESESEFSAFFGVGQIDKDIVPDWVESNDDGSKVTYSFETEADCDRALDLSDGVISYIVESVCDSCDKVFAFDSETCRETDDGDLCPECTAEYNAELEQEMAMQ